MRLVVALETAHAPIAGTPLLEVFGLVVRFGSLAVLNSAALELESGEIVGLVGENGAGKSTLVRCIAGDLQPAAGRVRIGGVDVTGDPAGAARAGVTIVWQDLALCKNLDVTSNLLLGREEGFLSSSDSRRHRRARAMLEALNVELDPTTPVRALSGGQRQLLAIARAVRGRPRLLVLDEPTAALGLGESAQVERLVRSLAAGGTAVLMISHDLGQMFRIPHRLVVMRGGRRVAEVDPERVYPDDVIALMGGRAVSGTARHQLSRLQHLVDELTTADRSSSLTLICSALGAALGDERLAIHRLDGGTLRCAATLGLAPPVLEAFAELELGPAGGPAGLAAARGEPVIDEDVRSSLSWARFGWLAKAAGIESSWALPIMGPDGPSGAITVLRATAGRPGRDELDLVTLYSGYAASALERDRLFGEVTSRNRVLETIREVLETLAGPILVAEGLQIALRALQAGLGADEVVLATGLRDGGVLVRSATSAAAVDPEELLAGVSPRVAALASGVLQSAASDGSVAVSFEHQLDGHGLVLLSTRFSAPAGSGALVARLSGEEVPETATALLGDAAHCLRLALEREEIGIVQQEAEALRRSRQLQRDFLSRLSHELRTPLTAIQGYAETLLQPDITWDGESVERFLSRMKSESARLGRLVEDLLDFSALESGVLRLQRDWCDLCLILDAARACLAPEAAARVTIAAEGDVPVILADHDRLEQVFVNLLDNAIRHNPPGTGVDVTVRSEREEVTVSVCDDGAGLPDAVVRAPFEPGRRHGSKGAGTGLGLSIARAIVDAHEGRIVLTSSRSGTCFRITLPVEASAPQGEEASDG